MSAEATARRVEELLDQLGAHGDPAVRSAAEELVRVLMGFYGTGLTRLTTLLREQPGGVPSRLLADETVSALLVLHDLHPEDLRTRVGRALEAARAEAFTVRELDAEAGALRLADDSGGCGCASTSDASRERVEAALSCFAPEITSVEFEAAEREPALLQIGRPPQLQTTGTAADRPSGAP